MVMSKYRLFRQESTILQINIQHLISGMSWLMIKLKCKLVLVLIVLLLADIGAVKSVFSLSGVKMNIVSYIGVNYIVLYGSKKIPTLST